MEWPSLSQHELRQSMSSKQDQSGMMRITTGRKVSGLSAWRALAVLLALSVVAWGVAYKASLYSSRSVAQHAIPPTRLLAHRACLERSGVLAGQVIRPAPRVSSGVAESVVDPGDLAMRFPAGLVAGSGRIFDVRVGAYRLRLPRPPPALA